jgi:putative ABC transport system ATP-binding protein
MKEMSFIAAQNISKVFGEPPEPVTALNNVSLEIGRGDFVAIMGPSGSGKTSLLSILGGMSAPTQGEVIIEGTSLYSLSAEERADFRAERLGFVFQELHLMPYLTAIDNVMLPLVISKRPDSLWDIALLALQQVGLEHKAKRLPNQLSSGEQARIAIARALVKAPPIILADEPTGNLDSKTGQEILRLLKATHDRGHTIIMVTHNEEAAKRARRTIHLRDGKIVAGHE